MQHVLGLVRKSSCTCCCVGPVLRIVESFATGYDGNLRQILFVNPCAERARCHVELCAKLGTRYRPMILDVFHDICAAHSILNL